MAFAVKIYKDGTYWSPAEGVTPDMLVYAINDHITRGQEAFRLAETAKVTYSYIESGQLRFKKHAFPMGDDFILKSCYMGKRGELVFVFSSDSGPRNAESFEFTERVAKRQLGGFVVYIDKMMKAMNERSKTLADKEGPTPKDKEERQEQYGEVYGSW